MKSWVQHVKDFSKKHKMKYGDALHNVKANIINLKVNKKYSKYIKQHNHHYYY